MSRTFHEAVLRGEIDQTGNLWFPLEDINKARGKEFTARDLRRHSLLAGEDFQVVDPRDELTGKFLPDAFEPGQILVSEPGMRRLMMRATGRADRHLQDWVTAQSLPVLDTPRRVGHARAALRSIVRRTRAHPD